MKTRPWTLLAMFVSSLLLARVALAQSPTEVEQARRHFKKGIELYQHAHYQEAIPEFEAALRVKTSPGLLFDLAQCKRQVGDQAEALLLYEKLVSEFPSSKEAPEALQWIQTLSPNGAPAAGTATTTEPPPPAAESPAPQPAPEQAPAETAPPPSAPPPATAETTNDEPAPTQAQEPEERAPIVAPNAVTPETENETDHEDHPVYTRWWFWTGAAVVVAAAAGGVAYEVAPKGVAIPNTPLGNQPIF